MLSSTKKHWSNWQAHSWPADLVFSMFLIAGNLISLDTFAVWHHSLNHIKNSYGCCSQSALKGKKTQKYTPQWIKLPVLWAYVIFSFIHKGRMFSNWFKSMIFLLRLVPTADVLVCWINCCLNSDLVVVCEQCTFLTACRALGYSACCSQCVESICFLISGGGWENSKVWPY